MGSGLCHVVALCREYLVVVHRPLPKLTVAPALPSETRFPTKTVEKCGGQEIWKGSIVVLFGAKGSGPCWSYGVLTLRRGDLVERGAWCGMGFAGHSGAS
jgi:hypothetical protein